MSALTHLRSLWTALLCALPLLLPAPTSAKTLTEPQKIEALIAAVAALPNAEFIRNGEAHPAADAAAHLRMKWGKAGKRVKTAEDFIRLCASQSYLSGTPYQIRFADGRVESAGPWLRARLMALEALR